MKKPDGRRVWAEKQWSRSKRTGRLKIEQCAEKSGRRTPDDDVEHRRKFSREIRVVLTVGNRHGFRKAVGGWCTSANDAVDANCCSPESAHSVYDAWPATCPISPLPRRRPCGYARTSCGRALAGRRVLLVHAVLRVCCVRDRPAPGTLRPASNGRDGPNADVLT